MHLLRLSSSLTGANTSSIDNSFLQFSHIACLSSLVGMKDSKSAAILENLPESEAAMILFALDTKVVGKILAKMDPQKAANLTQIIQKGPPFETQETKVNSQNN